MNGIISSIDVDTKSLKSKLNQIPSMVGLDLAKVVTTKKEYKWSKDSKPYKVAAIDYGIKLNILRLLDEHDCEVTVFPAKISADEITKFDPDGIFLSNGPGDPNTPADRKPDCAPPAGGQLLFTLQCAPHTREHGNSRRQ